jgi:hypothetical protein
MVMLVKERGKFMYAYLSGIGIKQEGAQSFNTWGETRRVK